MARLRVLVLMHEDLVPPDDLARASARVRDLCRTEHDVCTTLRALGHEVLKLGVRDDVTAMSAAVDRFAPQLAFNLLEEFRGEALYDHHVVSFLELVGLKYTGCNPRGLMLARDKALSKKILAYHGVKTPNFAVFPRGRAVRRSPGLRFPLIVKSLVEDASLGIAQASLVIDDARLRERVAFIHDRVATDAIAEEYIDGRELYVSVLGHARLQVLPAWELCFGSDPARIATERVKWSRRHQERHGIVSRRADLPPALAARLARMATVGYRALELSGYARFDFRLDAAGDPFVLEANPNPNIGAGEDFALSAAAAGMSYPALLERVMSLGMRGGRN